MAILDDNQTARMQRLGAAHTSRFGSWILTKPPHAVADLMSSSDQNLANYMKLPTTMWDSFFDQKMSKVNPTGRQDIDQSLNQQAFQKMYGLNNQEANTAAKAYQFAGNKAQMGGIANIGKAAADNDIVFQQAKKMAESGDFNSFNNLAKEGATQFRNRAWQMRKGDVAADLMSKGYSAQAAQQAVNSDDADILHFGMAEDQLMRNVDDKLPLDMKSVAGRSRELAPQLRAQIDSQFSDLSETGRNALFSKAMQEGLQSGKGLDESLQIATQKHSQNISEAQAAQRAADARDRAEAAAREKNKATFGSVIGDRIKKETGSSAVANVASNMADKAGEADKRIDDNAAAIQTAANPILAAQDAIATESGVKQKASEVLADVDKNLAAVSPVVGAGLETAKGVGDAVGGAVNAVEDAGKGATDALAQLRDDVAQDLGTTPEDLVAGAASLLNPAGAGQAAALAGLGGATDAGPFGQFGEGLRGFGQELAGGLTGFGEQLAGIFSGQQDADAAARAARPSFGEGLGGDASLKPFLDELALQNPRFLNAQFKDLGNEPENTNTNLGLIQNRLKNVGSEAATRFGDSRTALTGLAGEVNPAFAQVQADASSGFGTAIDELRGISGSTDPRFAAFEQAQKSLMESNALKQLQNESQFFNRRGLGGTSAALNAQNQTLSGLNQQQQLLNAQLGLQQLQRQDQARMQAAGLVGQRAGVESGLLGQNFGLRSQLQGQLAGLTGQQAQVESGLLGQRAGLEQQQLGNLATGAQMANQAQSQELEATTAGLQNLTIAPSLAIQKQAADNAGIMPQSGGNNNLQLLGTLAGAGLGAALAPAGGALVGGSLGAGLGGAFGGLLGG